MRQPDRYLFPLTGTPSYTSDIDYHMPNREDIFGFSGQSCNQCLSFEIVPHYFAAPDRDKFTRSTHKCKEPLANFPGGIRQDIDLHSSVRHNCAHMLVSIYALTQNWTNNKPYLRVVPLYNQVRKEDEVLQIRHASNPDKLIRLPLKIDEVIVLGAQKWYHWAFRVIRDGVTPIESHELREFLIRTQISNI